MPEKRQKHGVHPQNQNKQGISTSHNLKQGNQLALSDNNMQIKFFRYVWCVHIKVSMGNIYRKMLAKINVLFLKKAKGRKFEQRVFFNS